MTAPIYKAQSGNQLLTCSDTDASNTVTSGDVCTGGDVTAANGGSFIVNDNNLDQITKPKSDRDYSQWQQTFEKYGAKPGEPLDGRSRCGTTVGIYGPDEKAYLGSLYMSSGCSTGTSSEEKIGNELAGIVGANHSPLTVDPKAKATLAEKGITIEGRYDNPNDHTANSTYANPVQGRERLPNEIHVRKNGEGVFGVAGDAGQSICDASVKMNGSTPELTVQECHDTDSPDTFPISTQ